MSEIIKRLKEEASSTSKYIKLLESHCESPKQAKFILEKLKYESESLWILLNVYKRSIIGGKKKHESIEPPFKKQRELYKELQEISGNLPPKCELGEETKPRSLELVDMMISGENLGRTVNIPQEYKHPPLPPKFVEAFPREVEAQKSLLFKKGYGDLHNINSIVNNNVVNENIDRLPQPRSFPESVMGRVVNVKKGQSIKLRAPEYPSVPDTSYIMFTLDESIPTHSHGIKYNESSPPIILSNLFLRFTLCCRTLVDSQVVNVPYLIDDDTAILDSTLWEPHNNPHRAGDAISKPMHHIDPIDFHIGKTWTPGMTPSQLTPSYTPVDTPTYMRDISERKYSGEDDDDSFL